MTNKIEGPTANTGFASGGVKCNLEALYFYSSSMLVDSFVLRNTLKRKARNRYPQLLKNDLPNKKRCRINHHKVILDKI